MLSQEELTKIELRDAMLHAYNNKLNWLLETGRISIIEFDKYEKADIKITLRGGV